MPKKLKSIESTIRSELPGKNNAGLRARVRSTLGDYLDYDANLPRAADAVRSLARVVALTAQGRSAIDRIADHVDVVAKMYRTTYPSRSIMECR